MSVVVGLSLCVYILNELDFCSISPLFPSQILKAYPHAMGTFAFSWVHAFMFVYLSLVLAFGLAKKIRPEGFTIIFSSFEQFAVFFFVWICNLDKICTYV